MKKYEGDLKNNDTGFKPLIPPGFEHSKSYKNHTFNRTIDDKDEILKQSPDLEYNNPIYYVISLKIINNIAKDYCVTCFDKSTQATDRLIRTDGYNIEDPNHQIRLKKMPSGRGRRSSIYAKKETAGGIGGFLENPIYYFSYIEKGYYGSCITPLTIESLRKMYDDNNSELIIE